MLATSTTIRLICAPSTKKQLPARIFFSLFSIRGVPTKHNHHQAVHSFGPHLNIFLNFLSESYFITFYYWFVDGWKCWFKKNCYKSLYVTSDNGGKETRGEIIMCWTLSWLDWSVNWIEMEKALRAHNCFAAHTFCGQKTVFPCCLAYTRVEPRRWTQRIINTPILFECTIQKAFVPAPQKLKSLRTYPPLRTHDDNVNFKLPGFCQNLFLAVKQKFITGQQNLSSKINVNSYARINNKMDSKLWRKQRCEIGDTFCYVSSNRDLMKIFFYRAESRYYDVAKKVWYFLCTQAAEKWVMVNIITFRILTPKCIAICCWTV